jgi:hypothetical protein
MRKELVHYRLETYLDDIQLHYHTDSGTNFMLKAMHLKTHTFEDNLRACCHGYLFEKCRYSRATEG